MKKGLGRGFDSLIPTNLVDEVFDPTSRQDSEVSQLRELPLENVMPDPEQPRRFFDEHALAELSLSIKEHGIVQPIVVTPHSAEKYVIVAGERRWRAAKKAGLTVVPCIVRTLSAQNRLEISLIENLQRRDLNPLETATAYLKLRDQFNMTLEEIGQRVGGKSVSSISNTMRLLKLPKMVQQALFDGTLSEGQARSLIGLPEDVAEEMMTKIINEGWSVRRIEQVIAAWKKRGLGAEDEKAPSVPEVYQKAAETLSRQFHSSVRVRSGKKGGTIVIPFKDSDDFERLKKLLER